MSRLRVTLRGRVSERLDVELTPQLRPRSGLPLRRVVQDVQAPAAGGNDVDDELGALGADVAQRAAVGVQVGELLLHRAAGQRSHGSAEEHGRRKCFYSFL